MSSALFASLAEERGFRPDMRFNFSGAAAKLADDIACEDGAEAETDPAEVAFEHGFAEGKAAAEAQWGELLKQREDQFAKLVSALEFAARSETDLLADRFHQAVTLLCEHAVLPLAIDEEGLARRAKAAANMLRREADDKILKLNPDDAPLVAPLLAPELKVEADPTVERGGLRIDTEDGGVEDGPSLWRQRLIEAIGEC